MAVENSKIFRKGHVNSHQPIGKPCSAYQDCFLRQGRPCAKYHIIPSSDKRFKSISCAFMDFHEKYRIFKDI